MCLYIAYLGGERTKEHMDTDKGMDDDDAMGG